MCAVYDFLSKLSVGVAICLLALAVVLATPSESQAKGSPGCSTTSCASNADGTCTNPEAACTGPANMCFCRDSTFCQCKP